MKEGETAHESVTVLAKPLSKEESVKGRRVTGVYTILKS